MVKHSNDYVVFDHANEPLNNILYKKYLERHAQGWYEEDDPLPFAKAVARMLKKNRQYEDWEVIPVKEYCDYHY